ncbi:MAG TPA: DUF4233 domain-containing protein [Propionibacteriaceae bacterium]|nr:DUF4233 domain-containing protein [Propionibacteriaceae bacterium]
MTLSPTNPMRSVLMTLLFFEIVVFGLAVPVMIFQSEVSTGAAVAYGSAAALLALAGALLIRRPVGYLVGWVAQVAGVALGLVISAMFAIGGLFLALWVITFVLGKKLDAMPPQAAA